jgi:hypothetical protein
MENKFIRIPCANVVGCIADNEIRLIKDKIISIEVSRSQDYTWLLTIKNSDLEVFVIEYDDSTSALKVVDNLNLETLGFVKTLCSFGGFDDDGVIYLKQNTGSK